MRRQHRHHRQLETILAWGDDASYLRGNRGEIYYARHQIIDLDKPKRTYRASRGKQPSHMPIMEYVDWGKENTFAEKPIQIGKTPTAWHEYETMYTQSEEEK